MDSISFVPSSELYDMHPASKGNTQATITSFMFMQAHSSFGGTAFEPAGIQPLGRCPVLVTGGEVLPPPVFTLADGSDGAGGVFARR